MKPVLIFVYNADSGVFNALADLAHKTLSPDTYACNLCALTYSPLGMRKEWKRFLKSLDRELEFLHRDELKQRFGIEEVPLPAIFQKSGDQAEPLVGADALNACKSLDDLKQLIEDRLAG